MAPGGDADLGRGGPPAERGVRPERVVVPAPGLDENLRLAQGVEDLTVRAARRAASS